jgi:23S rRNA (cytidine1920-2'-O)/16S rRNA (cytidine1409-2'-O)-methyltransferase
VKKRLDVLLVERGLAETRSQAQALVLAGRVRGFDKAGTLLDEGTEVEVEAPPRFVSRGGEKLAHALETLEVSVAGEHCLDIGASTGGFTDCLLARGALRVHAVDVGHGQLHPRLRDDARVVAWEGVNARHLDPGRFPERPTLATVDVSFISLEKVLPAIASCLADPGEIVALVKPQFEVGRAQVGKGGVVRGWEARRGAVRAVASAAARIGLHTAGVAASALHGPKGNREVFLHLARDLPSCSRLEGTTLEAALAAAVPAEGTTGETIA